MNDDNNVTVIDLQNPDDPDNGVIDGEIDNDADESPDSEPVRRSTRVRRNLSGWVVICFQVEI